MGWASGSQLAENLWDELKKYIPKGKHQEVAELIVSSFEDNDADDWDYSDGSLYYTARPDEVEEDEE